MRGLKMVILALVLGGCQIGGGPVGGPVGKGGPAPDAITGGAIEVTALDGGAVPAAPGAAGGGTAGAKVPKPDAPKAALKRAVAVPEPAVPESAVPEPAVPPAATKSPQALACEKTGGSYGVAGKSGARTCVTPTGEGAKSCDRQTDCAGLCLARSRTCAPVTPLFGCNEILQADGSRVTLCID